MDAFVFRIQSIPPPEVPLQKAGRKHLYAVRSSLDIADWAILINKLI
jgi:hypothetical protein